MTINEAHEILKPLGWSLLNGELNYTFQRKKVDFCIEVYSFELEKIFSGTELMDLIREKFEDFYLDMFY